MVAEVITVQLGDYANHVGAHLWNLQDEAVACSEQEGWREVCATVDHSVLTHWTEHAEGAYSYCPRAVVVDSSGALGGVSFAGTPADDRLSPASWEGHVEVHSLGTSAKSQYRKALEAADSVDPDDEEAVAAYQRELEAGADALQSQPKYWTDYLQVDLHPSCVLTVPGVWHGLGEWAGWGPPEDASSSRETAEAAVDKVRWWAEQCDHLQGLQLLAEDVGGWGSLALPIVTELREQYQGLPMLYYSLQKPQAHATQTNLVRRALSQSISVAEVSQLVSLYVPLNPPVSQLKGSDGAAVLAAAIDTSTLPFRCTGAHTAAGLVLGETDLHSLVQLLTQQGTNLAALSLQMPIKQLHSTTAVAGASGSSSNLVLDLNTSHCSLLTSDVNMEAQVIAQAVTLRGAQDGPDLADTSHCKSALEGFLQQQHHGAGGSLPCRRQTCISSMPVALPLFFPAICDGPEGLLTGLSSSGLQTPMLTRRGQPARPAPGAMTRLTATFGFRDFLHVRMLKYQVISGSALGRSCLDQWGYSGSDAAELQESLQHMWDQYSSEDIE